MMISIVTPRRHGDQNDYGYGKAGVLCGVHMLCWSQSFRQHPSVRVSQVGTPVQPDKFNFWAVVDSDVL